MTTQQTAPTQYITAKNGVRFAYRRLGLDQGVPLVMHIHFRANMDFWDPLLVNNLAAKRPIILFDQAGVGRSSGEVATTYQGWADNVIALVEALDLRQIDLLGFSMGGYTVGMVALTAPRLIRKLIITGSGPSVPSGPQPGIVWPRDQAPPDAFKFLRTSATRADEEASITCSFFPDTDAGKRAARAYFARIRTRTAADHDPPLHELLGTAGTARQTESAVAWNQHNPRDSYDRLGELAMPVLILNGDDDKLIPTSRSWELLKGIENAQLIIYPKAGHGFIWQYAERVAADIATFLDHDLDRVEGLRL